MNESAALSTTRKSLLARGALLIGGALGLGVARAEAASPHATGGPRSFKLYGRSWRVQAPGRRSGELPGQGERTSVFGELHRRSRGESKVGEFYSAAFATLAPFGPTPYAAGGLEMHTFNLEEGSILGLGSHFGEKGTYAVVGGTGVYHGARGSYIATQRPVGLGGNGTAEFAFDLIG